MGGAYSTRGRDKNYIYFGLKTEGKRTLTVDMRITLKWMLKIIGCDVWIGFSWLVKV
jgi:hypothetical protein